MGGSKLGENFLLPLPQDQERGDNTGSLILSHIVDILLEKAKNQVQGRNRNKPFSSSLFVELLGAFGYLEFQW